MTQLQLDEEIVSRPVLSNNKADTAHYVISPDPAETNHAYVMRARIEGFPVEALCGYTWVPFKVATGLPVCSECEEISHNYLSGNGEPRE